MSNLPPEHPYNEAAIASLVNFLNQYSGQVDKRKLEAMLASTLGLKKVGKLWVSSSYAIRVSSSKKDSPTFSNTVLGLNKLLDFDSKIPVFCVVVQPSIIRSFLMNSSFINKLSHSAQTLSVDKITGSFNGNNILREVAGLKNQPENFKELYLIHVKNLREDPSAQLVRIINASKSSELKSKNPKAQPRLFSPTDLQNIKDALNRTRSFVSSPHFNTLREKLRRSAMQHAKPIVQAAKIQNSTMRGRVIEYLMCAPASQEKDDLIKALEQDNFCFLDTFCPVDHAFGDHLETLGDFSVAVDVKSKLSGTKSNPKAFNIEKFLEFHKSPNSVFLFFFITINQEKGIIKSPRLTPCLESNLLEGYLTQKHWSARGSRGTTQMTLKSLEVLFSTDELTISLDDSVFESKLEDWLELPAKEELSEAQKAQLALF